MRKAALIAYCLCFVWMLFTMLGPVSYGHGLGDLFYHAAAIAAFLIITILFILGRKVKSADDVFYIFMFIAIALTVFSFTLKFTYYRGPECSWNGNIIC